MNRRSILLGFLFFAVASPFASAASQPQLTLKNKSSFSNKGNPRDPFWPIGWKPAVTTAGDHTDSELPASAFVVSSITVQPKARFAIINGKIMQEGQEFGLKMGSDVVHLSVHMIQDGKVILEQHGRQIIVPLRRK